MTLDEAALEEPAGPEPFAALREALGQRDRTSWLPRLTGLPGRRIAATGGLVLLLAATILGTSALRSPGRTATQVPNDAMGPPAVDPADPTTTAEEPVDAARLWPDAPITVAGNEVRRGNVRWEVGAVGDTIVIGDWDCDGEAAPAVLRPAVGLFVFDGWADRDEERSARRVPGGEGAVAIAAPTCGAANLRRADGTTFVLETGAAR